jgi:hypothetical protein
MMEDQVEAVTLRDRDLGVLGEKSVHGIHMENIAHVDGIHGVLEVFVIEGKPMLEVVLFVGIEEHVGMRAIQDLGLRREARRWRPRRTEFGLNQREETMDHDRHGELVASK